MIQPNNPAKDGGTELIDKIIANQSAENAGPSVVPESEGQVLITTARVVNIRYKIYVLVLLALIGIFVYYYGLPIYDVYLSTNQKLQGISMEIENFPKKKMQYEADKKLITTIGQQSNQIISCLNSTIGCAQLADVIKNDFGTARSYIQLGTLSTAKMPINEKKILANINEYLIKKNATSRNGFLNSIAIGEPSVAEGVLGSVPVRLNVTFTDKDSLLSFIDNVEKNVLEDPDYRILYKLDEVSYDIVNYATEQKVDISMHAYFIK